MFLALKSSQVRLSDIDAFANRAILPRISTLPGVAQVLIFGTQKYAVRVRANLDQLAVRGLTLQELQNAIVNANSSKPVGAIADQPPELDPRRHRSDQQGGRLHAGDRDLAERRAGARVRRRDRDRQRRERQGRELARTARGPSCSASTASPTPTPSRWSTGSRRCCRRSRPSCRPASRSRPWPIALEPIRHAIADVEFTLALAGLLVIVAIYFFLRSFRATLIPAIALPISVIGTFAGMYLCGHSLDNISLLALTLAVGFVVDDAIVMLENIVRHIEAGEKPMEAAFKGSKEVGFTIISMTLSLVAVFIPVLFMGGVVGRMFNEFGLVITFAILISGIVSLTLTPMLCARLLKPIDHHEKHNFLLRSFEWTFNKITDGYAWALRRTVRLPRLVLLITLGTFVLSAVLFQAIPKGFFPTEDIGQITGSTVGPDDASFDAMVARQSALAEIIRRDPDVQSVISTVGGGNAASTVNSGRMFIVLRPSRSGPTTSCR